MKKQKTDEENFLNNKIHKKFRKEFEDLTDEQFDSMIIFLTKIADITIETYFNNDETNKESSSDEQGE